MGLLDGFDIGPTIIIGGRKGRKVLRDGEPGEATIVGIAVDRRPADDETEPRYTYALDVRPAGGGAPFRCGVRQRLTPRREEAHLGVRVPVRIRGDEVAIDWERFTTGEDDHDVFLHGWGMRDAPEPGVADPFRREEQERVAAGEAVQVTVLRAAAATSILGPLENVDLDVEVRHADGRTEQRRLTRLLPPVYARHLLREGVVLPGGVDRGGERLTIDWARAASGDVVVDPSPAAPAEDVVQPAPAVDRLADAAFALAERAVGAAGGQADAQIDLDRYVEVSVALMRDRVPPAEHEAYAAARGVPGWAGVDAAMKAQMMRDPAMATRYGAAWEAATKRRRR